VTVTLDPGLPRVVERSRGDCAIEHHDQRAIRDLLAGWKLKRCVQQRAERQKAKAAVVRAD